jgi:hypothetical protein
MLEKFPHIINREGKAIYYGKILSDELLANYFSELLNKIEWKNEVVVMFGKEIITKRKVAFYSDLNIEYRYSQKTKKGGRLSPPAFYGYETTVPLQFCTNNDLLHLGTKLR